MVGRSARRMWLVNQMFLFSSLGTPLGCRNLYFGPVLLNRLSSKLWVRCLCGLCVVSRWLPGSTCGQQLVISSKNAKPFASRESQPPSGRGVESKSLFALQLGIPHRLKSWRWSSECFFPLVEMSRSEEVGKSGSFNGHPHTRRVGQGERKELCHLNWSWTAVRLSE